MRRPKNPDHAEPICVVKCDWDNLPHLRAETLKCLGYLPMYENPLISGLHGKDLPDIQRKALERYGRRVKVIK